MHIRKLWDKVMEEEVLP